MNNVNWLNIRPWKGTQDGGFQELCIQIARVESLTTSRFVSLGAPDAGVECYCVLHDGSEWGWQAKYFTTSLKSPQWQQLDHSVKTALDKHPNLVRYYVCIPRDRSDARHPNKMSEMDRWHHRVCKWEGMGKRAGYGRGVCLVGFIGAHRKVISKRAYLVAASSGLASMSLMRIGFSFVLKRR